MKGYYCFIRVLFLSSILLLTACHNDSQTSLERSEAINQMSDSNHMTISGTNQQNDSNNSQPQKSSTMDVLAIANGDFSSVVGTWQNANGDTLVFDVHGLVSDTQSLQPQGVSGEKAIFALVPLDSDDTGGTTLFMIPAKKASISGNTFNTDVITVGQGEAADAAPYYKVN